MTNLWDNIHSKLDEALNLTYSDDAPVGADGKATPEDALAKAEREKKLLKRVALVDPNLVAYYGGAGYGPYKPRFSHISFKTLKEMSLRDPIVATIFQTRLNQVSTFARPQANRYDTGFKIFPKDAGLEIEPESQEEQEVKFLTDFIMNTGIMDENRDPKDYMNFETWLKLVTRDNLTFGSAAIETVRDQRERLYAFLPVPTETVFYANKSVSDELVQSLAEGNKSSFFNGAEKEQKQEEYDQRIERLKDGEYEFVQVIEGRIVEGFTDQELIYSLGYPNNFIDSNGYCIGMLEQATSTITGHLQANNYNNLFFTHGFASRGLLWIQGDITPSQLQAFRGQWAAQIAGNANSWRTPILAGVDNVQWVPLSANNRDMEYTNHIDHIIRTLCGLFQISPVEIGFDYLTKGSEQKSMGESSNEWKIQDSKDRGLRPLLMWIENIINTYIIPGIDPELGKKYSFSFVGLDAESKEEELNRQTAEIAVHTSMNEIRKEIEKDPVLGGDVPLNVGYLDFLFKTHTVGEIRSKLLKYAGAETDPMYAYMNDGGAFLQNRQMVMQMMNPNQGQVDENGNPIDDGSGGGGQVDENGNPVEGGGDEAPAYGDGSEEGDAGEGEAPPQDEAGKEEAPPEGEEEAPEGGDEEKSAVDAAVIEYLKEHPELQKSLAKSEDAKEANARLEGIREDYLKTYQLVQKKMLAEILGELKEELSDEPDTDSSKN